MGCQKVSADICGKKKNLFCLPTVSKGSLGRTVVFFLSAVKKNVTDLHIFVCTVVCVCVCVFKFSFFVLTGWQ